MKKVLLVAFCAMFVMTACWKKTSGVKLLPVKSNDLWGYVDTKGSYVINPQFEIAYPFFDGLARVVSDGKVGYISSSGKYVITPQYYDGTDFSSGLAFVVTENSYPICINKKGKEVFRLNNVEWVEAFREGMARYSKSDDKYGFVNTKGEIVIRAQFEGCGEFSDGLAWVKSNDKYGYIDTKGNIVINYQFADAEDFHEGLAAVSNGKMWGFINKKGEYVINPQFENVKGFSEGLAAFSNGRMTGYIDKTGKYTINPQYENATDFSEGIAACRMGDMWGYVDKDGKMVINPQFEMVTNFKGGIALVMSNDKIGCINKKGSFVINPQFDNVEFYPNAKGMATSTYYDVSGFVKEFLGTSSSLGTTLMNSFKPGSTLKTVADNKLFSSADVNDLTTLVYKNSGPWGLDGDVEFERVVFTFSAPLYETTYDYYYYSSNRTYQWDTPLEAIECVLSLHGKAYDRGAALAAAVAENIKDKASINDMKNHGCVYYGYSTKNKQGYAVVTEDNQIHVIFCNITEQEFQKCILSLIETIGDETNSEGRRRSAVEEDWFSFSDDDENVKWEVVEEAEAVEEAPVGDDWY